MSAISSYNDLLYAASEYSAREDFAHLFPRFIAMLETRLNRRLRVGGMETSCSLVTAADGSKCLDADFVEMRMLTDANGNVLKQMAPQSVQEIYGIYSGTPKAYMIKGGTVKGNFQQTLYVVPAATGTFTADYYSAIPPLTQVGVTNFLLNEAPMIYLYGVLAEIYGWATASGREQSPDKAKTAADLAEQEILAYEKTDRSRRFNDMRIAARGPTP